MSMPIITSIISAASIILGSLLGAFFSYKINNVMYIKKCAQDKILSREKINYDVSKRLIEISENANIIRLDIATSIFECIRSIKKGDIDIEYIAYFPIYLDYSKAISSLYNAFSLKEISYIYQLYARIDKLNYDIKNHNTKDIKKDIILILNKIYGDNYMKILMVDPDKVSFKELYQNNYIISEYKEILLKLDEICERWNKVLTILY